MCGHSTNEQVSKWHPFYLHVVNIIQYILVLRIKTIG